ncbi:type II toxin-antitoxin system PemK/MazF family toxin [Roseiflexus sp.]|uniref:type II toxin-antitoxin system PemK/MazF family toxin n=1 Tax=Roseiflexus sp. TaxID=2562120 RepID=UPI00398AB37A
MKKAGQVVLFRFPQTDLEKGKLRPALLLGKLPGEYDDWLICMISSQIPQYIAGFDEIVKEGDQDFEPSGLKVTSVIRVGRLAVVSGEILLGAIGEISLERLKRVRQNLVNWLSQKQNDG